MLDIFPFFFLVSVDLDADGDADDYGDYDDNGDDYDFQEEFQESHRDYELGVGGMGWGGRSGSNEHLKGSSRASRHLISSSSSYVTLTRPSLVRRLDWGNYWVRCEASLVDVMVAVPRLHI